jgi:hypothetical protein
MINGLIGLLSDQPVHLGFHRRGWRDFDPDHFAPNVDLRLARVSLPVCPARD